MARNKPAGPTMYPIPAGTPMTACRSDACGAGCYWVDAPTGKRMLVSADPPGCLAPTAKEDGIGVSHFTNCVDADKFRKGRR